MPGSEARAHTVLVVDDEDLVRMSIADYLRDCGFQVLEAATAGDAVAVLSSAHVDVVFSDVRMPGKMNGFGLARWVRANRPRVPVMLTSGYAHGIDRVGSLCDDSPIAKPYEERHVAERIRRLLSA